MKYKLGVYDMKNVFHKDLFRFYGNKKTSIKSKLFRPKQLQYIKIYRKCRSAKCKFVKLWYSFRLSRLQNKTAIQIPYKTEIGEGFYIGHLGAIAINPEAKLGKNINIALPSRSLHHLL